MGIEVNLKETYKRREIDIILDAEYAAAEKGDAKSVILLSKLLKKKLKTIKHNMILSKE